MPVFKHALLYLEKRSIIPDIIVNLRPTAPLRESEDIDNAINILLETNADSVRSFCKIHEHPYWMYKIEEGRAITFMPENFIKQYPRRQLLPKLYILNGAVEVMKAECIMKNSLYGEDMRAYIMPRSKSIDLDTEEDFKRLELFI